MIERFLKMKEYFGFQDADDTGNKVVERLVFSEGN